MKERYVDSVFSKAGADPDPCPHLTTGVQVLAEHAGTTLQGSIWEDEAGRSCSGPAQASWQNPPSPNKMKLNHWGFGLLLKMQEETFKWHTLSSPAANLPGNELPPYLHHVLPNLQRQDVNSRQFLFNHLFNGAHAYGVATAVSQPRKIMMEIRESKYCSKNKNFISQRAKSRM